MKHSPGSETNSVDSCNPIVASRPRGRNESGPDLHLQSVARGVAPGVADQVEGQHRAAQVVPAIRIEVDSGLSAGDAEHQGRERTDEIQKDLLGRAVDTGDAEMTGTSMPVPWQPAPKSCCTGCFAEVQTVTVFVAPFKTISSGVLSPFTSAMSAATGALVRQWTESANVVSSKSSYGVRRAISDLRHPAQMIMSSALGRSVARNRTYASTRVRLRTRSTWRARMTRRRLALHGVGSQSWESGCPNLAASPCASTPPLEVPRTRALSAPVLRTLDQGRPPGRGEYQIKAVGHSRPIGPSNDIRGPNVRIRENGKADHEGPRRDDLIAS